MILTPRLRIPLRSCSIDLTFTLLSLRSFEAETGEPLGFVADLGSVRSLLYAMAVPFQRDITPREIGRLFEPATLTAALPGITELIQACLPTSAPSRSQDGADAGQGGGLTNWLETWAIGRFDMRFGEDEFWLLTPAMYAAVVDRLRAAAGLEREMTMEERSAMVLRKVEMINEAWGGRDLRQKR